MENDQTDCAAAQQELAKDTPAFTREQRVVMGKALSAHMTGTRVSSGGTTKTQKNLWLHEYLTETVWKKLFDKTFTWEQKTELLADFMIDVIGLRNPDDNTAKIGIAILSVTHGRPMEPQESYDELHKFKNKLKEKRNPSLNTGKQTMTDFPQDVSSFTRIHNVYQQCDPPIPSRIDTNRIRQMTRKDVLPSRNTNKSLGKTSPQQSSPSSSSGGGNAMVAQLMTFILAQHSNAGSMVPPIEPPPPLQRPRAKKAPMAIEDGEAEPSEPTEPAPKQLKPSSESDDVDRLIEQAKKTIAANKELNSDKKKPKGDDDRDKADGKEDEGGEEESDQDEEGDEEEDYVPTKTRSANKKGGRGGGGNRVVKRPAKATAKCKAVASGSKSVLKKPSASTSTIVESCPQLPNKYNFLFKTKDAKGKTRGSFTSRAYCYVKSRETKHPEYCKTAYAMSAKVWDAMPPCDKKM